MAAELGVRSRAISLFSDQTFASFDEVTSGIAVCCLKCRDDRRRFLPHRSPLMWKLTTKVLSGLHFNSISYNNIDLRRNAMKTFKPNCFLLTPVIMLRFVIFGFKFAGRLTLKLKSHLKEIWVWMAVLRKICLALA